jgi:hypothetical protein
LPARLIDWLSTLPTGQLLFPTVKDIAALYSLLQSMSGMKRRLVDARTLMVRRSQTAVVGPTNHGAGAEFALRRRITYQNKLPKLRIRVIGLIRQQRRQIVPLGQGTLAGTHI